MVSGQQFKELLSYFSSKGVLIVKIWFYRSIVLLGLMVMHCFTSDGRGPIAAFQIACGIQLFIINVMLVNFPNFSVHRRIGLEAKKKKRKKS